MANTKTEQETDISRTLGVNASVGKGKAFRRWFFRIAVVLLLALAAFKWSMGSKNDAVKYKTLTVERGNIVVTVTATGTLEPTNQVDVGSELSGIVRTVDADYNDSVAVGQVLATLDSSKLEAEVKKSGAALASARAKLLQAKATVREVQTELSRLRQLRKLSDNKVPSQTDMDAAEAKLDRSLAEEAMAKAQITEAEATLNVNQTNLEKAVIRSPVNGIILARSVEVGQTVAASLQAPVLFTLAEDLARMELHVDVDEADVGVVQAGQEAAFTVDAYPNRTFPAQITQVRYGAQTKDGVVTYKTVLKVDNTDLSLRPGMTATADITVKKIENAVLIPNAALRFVPPKKESEKESRNLFTALFLPRPPRAEIKKNGDADAKHKTERVYTLRGANLTPVSVKTGATDGTVSELAEGDVKPGMELVTDTVTVKE
ncbi:MAG: efflux transporter periplasmic adaptor subunit [Desulfobacteraceae bacterium IS3]|nr:MAG: efflux transporter periplasmic adaptor subunit [Desulfobacteraceae bacterium IS3]